MAMVMLVISSVYLLKFLGENVYLENLGYGHRVQHSKRHIWQISTSIKVVLEHFSLALTIFEIFTFQNL